MPDAIHVARRAALSLAAILLLLPGLSSAQDSESSDPKSLKQLLSAYANMAGLEAQYVEEKHMGLLSKPLTSEGRIYFARPGLLLRKVQSPFPSTVVITPREVRMTDSSGSQTIDLASRPDVRPFVESMVWLLSGNAAALQTAYEITFKATDDRGWRLLLKPKKAPLSKIISHMEIRGRGLAVEEIEVQETSGDRSITRILDANPKRTFDAAERKALFGVTP